MNTISTVKKIILSICRYFRFRAQYQSEDKGSCQEIVPNTIITIGIIFMFAILPQGEVVHVSYLVI